MQLNIIKIHVYDIYTALESLRTSMSVLPSSSHPVSWGWGGQFSRGERKCHRCAAPCSSPWGWRTEHGVPGEDGAFVFQHSPTGHPPQLITITYLLQSYKILFKFFRSQKHLQSNAYIYINSNYLLLGMNFILTVNVWQI